MATASEVLAQLAALAGEKEKTSSGTVGSGNYISVNKPYGLQGQAYCGTSLRYAFEQAGSTLLKGCTNPHYVPTLRQYMDKQGWRVTNNASAQAGDIFVYGSDQHVGFVYAPYSGATVITLEGNATVYATLAQAKASTAGSGSFEGIGYKKRYLNSSYKVYRPTYDGATATTTTNGGISSTGVTAFQKWLGVTADGVYGPVTKKAAVKALQKALNSGYSAALTVDGVYGALTKAALAKHPVKSGATGDLVYILQGLLYCRGYDPGGFDGIFGASTLAAVKKFQSAKGLTVDGEAGADTFSALCAA
jgi:peptidoglycan hydrolase-like protein with peptidoglycan-binding domain